MFLAALRRQQLSQAQFLFADSLHACTYVTEHTPVQIPRTILGAAMLPPKYTPEPLPQYSSQIYLAGYLAIKTESQFSRRWTTHWAELNNTALKLQSSWGRAKSLSLQNAKVGFAADYTKGAFPVRLIAQGTQLLFDFDNLGSALEWLGNLQQSINISLPIDLRQEPRVPRPALCDRKDPCITDYGVLLSSLHLAADEMMY